MLIWENIKLAASAIRANKMRSFLTMLGMIIGIFSVITIVSLGDTMRGAMADEYKNVGLGLAYIYIYPENDYYTEKEMFTLDEMESLKEAMGDELSYVGMGEGGRVDIKAGRKTVKVYTTAMNLNPTAYKDLKIIHGRMLSDKDIRDKRLYTVIQNTTAKELFGTEDATGKTIKTTIGEEEVELTIIGIYESQDSTLMKMLSSGSPSNIYLPETLYVSEYGNYWSIQFVVKDTDNFDQVMDRVMSYISRLKNVNKENIRSDSAQSEMGMVDSLLGNLALIVAAIAAISLLVGGIGIMNIMLVSVTERTREIGIRKALGARTKDIMIQFLTEAAIISAVGGTIGMALGAGLITVLGIIFGISAVVKPVIVIGAFAFSALVGIGFGMYPARRAAKKDPVEALRYE